MAMWVDLPAQTSNWVLYGNNFYTKFCRFPRCSWTGIKCILNQNKTLNMLNIENNISHVISTRLCKDGRNNLLQFWCVGQTHKIFKWFARLCQRVWGRDKCSTSFIYLFTSLSWLLSCTTHWIIIIRTTFIESTKAHKIYIVQNTTVPQYMAVINFFQRLSHQTFYTCAFHTMLWMPSIKPLKIHTYQY